MRSPPRTPWVRWPIQVPESQKQGPVEHPGAYHGRQRPGLPGGVTGGEGAEAGVGGGVCEGEPPTVLCCKCSSRRALAAGSRTLQAGSTRARRSRQAR